MLIVPFLCFLSIFSFQKVFGETECPLTTVIEDRRIDKTKLRLVQFNVEWLFIDYYAAMDCPGNGCTWKNQTEAQIHLNTVAKIIDELNPDIINFCEIEGCDELNMLKDVLSNGSSYNSYLKKGTDTATGQNVGLLTRVDPLISLYRTESKYAYPIINSTCGYTGSPSSSGVSKHYITEFILDNMNIALISAHLIAIPTDPARCAQREAQAYVLQEVISDYIKKDYEIILLGDFNDYDAEIVDANNDKPTSQVLSILKGYNDNKYNLYSIAETIVKQERYSDWWDSDNNCDTSSQSDYSMIDHILVTDAIRKNIINTFIYHVYNGSCTTYNSDHYPVVIDLVFTN
jgi:exonuclease III